MLGYEDEDDALEVTGIMFPPPAPGAPLCIPPLAFSENRIAKYKNTYAW